MSTLEELVESLKKISERIRTLSLGGNEFVDIGYSIDVAITYLDDLVFRVCPGCGKTWPWPKKTMFFTCRSCYGRERDLRSTAVTVTSRQT